MEGFYKKLRNPDVDVQERVCLAKQVWESDDIYLPNKKQVLIDVLVGIFTGRKKQEDRNDESQLLELWKCFHYFLSESQTHGRKTAGDPLFLKPSTAQMTVDTLQMCESEETCNDLLQAVVSCCDIVSASSSLSYVYTSNIDILIQLMASFSKLLYRFHSNQEIPPAGLSKVLHHFTSEAVKKQKSVANQKRVFCFITEKLLVPTLLLNHRLKIDCHLTDSKHPSSVLYSFVLDALFEKEHRLCYVTYLNILSCDSDAGKAPPKHIVTFFKTISDLLQQTDRNCNFVPEATIGFLASFCDRFFKSIVREVKVKLIKFICSLFGVGVSPDVHVKSGNEALLIKGLKVLFDVVRSCEVYDVAHDSSSGDHQLNFYRHIVDVLLQCVRRNEDWFNCLLCLLDMNHNILEPKLVEILSQCWLYFSNIDASVLLFTEILNLYAKLRQVPKWLDKILLSIKESDQAISIDFASSFISRFGEVAENLPQGMTIDIWSRLTRELKSNYLTVEGMINTKALNAVAFLSYTFLHHARVAEYGITDTNLKKVEELLTNLQQDILPAVFSLSKDNSEMLFPFLLMAEVYGSMALLLAQYGKQETNMNLEPIVLHVSDISFLHSYLSAKEWKLVHKRSKKLGDKRNIYIWDRLFIQKLKYFALYVDGESSNSTDKCSIIEELLPPVDVSSSDLKEFWDGSHLSIRESNSLVAKWSLASQYLPLVQSSMDLHQIIQISKFALQTVKDSDENNKRSDAITLADITDTLLKDSSVHENRHFLSSIVTVLWGNLHKANASNQSPKKKKHNIEVQQLLNVFSMIGDEDTTWCTDMSRSEEIKKAVERVNEVLQYKSTAVCCMNVSINSLHTCIKILAKVPIQNLSDCDLMRCIMGCICVLVVVIEQLYTKRTEEKPITGTDNDTDLLEEIVLIYIDICAILFESSRTASVFMLLNPNVFLKWMEHVHGKISGISKKFSDRLNLLMSTASMSIIQDFQVINSLGSTLDRINATVKCITTSKIDINSASSSLWILQNVIKGLSKLYRRRYLPEDTKHIIQDYLKETLNHFIALLPVYHLASDTAVDIVHVSVLSLYGDITSYCCHDNETDEALQRIIDNFSKLFGLVTLKLHQKEISTDVVISCLQIFQCWCMNSNSLSQVLTESVNCELWSLLCDLLLNSITSNGSYKSVVHEQKKQQGSFNTSLSYILYGKKDNTLCAKTTEDEVNKEQTVKKERTSSSVSLIKYSESKNSLLISKIENVMRTFILIADEDHFGKILLDLEVKLNPGMVLTDREDIIVSLHILQQLVDYNLTQEKAKPLISFLNRVVLNFQSILQLSENTVDESFVKDICLSILNAETQILNLTHSEISRKTSVTCLHGLQFIPLDYISHAVFVPAFHAIYDVLNTLMFSHTIQMLDVIPTVLNCTSRLLKVIIQRGSQDVLSKKPECVDGIVTCADLVKRFLTLLSTHKLEFAKVAVYIVADYVTEIQKVTLLPPVKKSLVTGIYNILALCDVHGISLLQSVLQSGVREVFQVLYSDYCKYFKYTGRI